MEKEAIETAFTINPTTVYGFLVALLLGAIIYLVRQNSIQSDKFITLLTQNIKVIETFSTYINKENIELHKDDLIIQMREQIRNELKLVVDALKELK